MTTSIANTYVCILSKFVIIKLFFLLICPVTLAQTLSKESINQVINSVNTYTENRSIEKIYLHTDKSSYVPGDTLWFKAYLFNESQFTASKKSGILYIELANDSNLVVKRIMLPVYKGLTFGQITLDDTEISQGGYTLRAYTNWLRNFEEDYIFKKRIYISNAVDKDWLLNVNTRVDKNAGKDKIGLRLKVSDFDKTPVGLRELQLRMFDAKKAWFKSNIETKVDGSLDINFDLPPNADSKTLTLSIQDMRKGEGNRRLLTPLLINRTERIDLQFMPEGGNIVAGLTAHIAFKALNEDGTGVDVFGKIYDGKGQAVAEFKSDYRGIGAFYLIPIAGETYTARLNLPNGSNKSYPLPAVQNSGIIFNVNNAFKRDACKVLISASPDIMALGKTYILIAESQGVVCYGAALSFNDGAGIIMVNKNLFPSGIARFTLIGPDKNVLNERIVFINHSDNLNIQFAHDKTLYKQRDSVSLRIKVSDKDGRPVHGSFSLAITDDDQVKIDSIKDESIITRMLLTGDLKGNVENPGYYVQSLHNPKVWQHLDQLLLAQGWVGYDFNEVFRPAQTFKFQAEQEFLIKGTVTNAFNKPVEGSGVVLLSKKPLLVMDTVTNKLGSFVFKGIYPVDTAAFFIQSRNKRNKSFNVGIEVDEFVAPIFKAPDTRLTPWYVNIDTGNFSMINKQVQLKKHMEKMTGKVLKEVVIKGKTIVKNSKNLNGPGEADIIISEEELSKSGRKTLGDLLEARVKGFGARFSKTGAMTYKVNDKFVHLIIDGVDTEFFLPEGESSYEHLKQYFDYYDAEEIKGIEVMTSGKYQMNYTVTFLPPLSIPWDHAFIEVTTRGGKGPFVKKAVGTYLYKPMAFTLPKKFYAPKYTSNSTANMTDIRSTIFWEPNVVTNKEGMATVTFYTADNPGTYSLIIEGSDMNGKLGVKRGQLRVELND